MTNLTATDECGFDTDECGSAIDECGPAIDECGSESGSDTSSTADKSGSATVSTAESSHSCNSQTSTLLVQFSGTAAALAILQVRNDNPLRAVAERCAFIRVIVTRSSLERSQYSSLSFPPDLFSRYF
jgi:hypothetical protein